VLGVGADTLPDAQRRRAATSRSSTRARTRISTSANAAQDASIIRFVNQILTEAIESRATDVHIEPYETRCGFAIASTAC
jgi:type II secretory ATPase GspE/PulE/Tfp pilus assembly ATPase PilB-like protein